MTEVDMEAKCIFINMLNPEMIQQQEFKQQRIRETEEGIIFFKASV